MICAGCGKPIQWREGQGWLEVGPDNRVIYGTSDCPERVPVTAGHRLLPDWQVRTKLDKDGKVRFYKRRNWAEPGAWERTTALDFRILKDEGAEDWSGR